MDIIVTEDNVAQVVQALYENVKSNQHRMDETEPILKAMAPQVQKLFTLIHENGFAQAVKDNASEMKKFREEFLGFLLVREETCPTAKRAKEEFVKSRDIKTWKVALIRLGIAALALIPSIILIIERSGG